MISKDKIRLVAEKKIDEIGGYIVDVKVTSGNQITIYFDRLDGVLLEHCLIVSKYIEANFDRDIEDYSLTVCSAGLDSPFIVNEQYQKNIGEQVGVLLKDGKRKRGKIISYTDVLTLEVKKKKKGTRKEYMIEQIVIPKDKIKETKLNVKFI